MTLTPDYIVVTPSGNRFFRSQAEAIEYGEKHHLTAYRCDYEQVEGGSMPHEQQVRTVIFDPQEMAA